MLVTLVVVTYDRPDSLRQTLACLLQQKTDFPFKILVVDNHPESGLTPPIVANLPNVHYLRGPGRGLCSARNRAISVIDTEFIVWTNDDVVVNENWMQQLIDQFTRPDIMVVCSQVEPLSLETEAERLSQKYCRLTKGPERMEFDLQWLSQWRRKSPRTHAVGVGNSFATRAKCFRDPKVGLFNEALGAGTALGGADDQYFWYRVLKAGHTIVYEPSIVLYDRYETDLARFHQKVFNYNKGIVGYEMELFFRDHDPRGAVQLLIILPTWRLREFFRLIKTWLRERKRPEYFPVFITSVKGNLMGSVSWLIARRNAQQPERASLNPRLSERTWSE